MRPALGDVVVRLAPVVDRQVHHESGFRILPGVDTQANFPGDCDHAGVTRLLHGLPPHRVGPWIEPERGAVTGRSRLTLDDRRVVLTQALRLDGIAGKTQLAHRSDMRVPAR